MSGSQKASILGVIALQAVLVAAAQRDLSARSGRQLRGPKVMWRVLTTNTIGTLAYFAVGRL